MRGKLTMIAGWALMLATPLVAQAAPADLDSLFDAAGRGGNEDAIRAVRERLLRRLGLEVEARRAWVVAWAGGEAEDVE